MLSLQILLFLALLYTCVEDLRTQELPLWILAVLWGLWVSLHLLQYGWMSLLTSALLNGLTLGFSLLLLRQYSIWHMGVFINKAMGIGDVYFLVAFAWGYPPEIFLWIWVLGTLASLVISKLLQQKRVPYAGHLAATNACWLCMEFWLQ